MRLPDTPPRGRRRSGGVRALAAAWLAALATGCTGSFYLGIGDDDYYYDDLPPEVSVVASVDAAAPGAPLRLAAAASDDFGVDRVVFFRIERDGAVTTLATDRSPPWETDTVMPATAAAEVRFFARAIDGRGQATDSASVAVAVRR